MRLVALRTLYRLLFPARLFFTLFGQLDGKTFGLLANKFLTLLGTESVDAGPLFLHFLRREGFEIVFQHSAAEATAFA